MKRTFREVDLIALLAGVLCCVLAYTARYTVNPDGVSYLNLADAIRHGSWSSFVQGYWSPLYPVIIAAAAAITGKSGVGLLPVVHALNAITVLAVLVLLRHWARLYATPWFGRATIAALLVSSARPPRVEAITPDLLLLAFATGLGYELIVHRGRRWWLVGLLLGAMFFSKTSTWPWLIVAQGINWWGRPGTEERRDIWRSAVVAVAVLSLWVVPLSQKMGTMTLGSAGRLNYCWYLGSCDSQTPDTHAGAHTDYVSLRTADGRTFDVAQFAAPASPWTYAPWGDPTAWEMGIRSHTSATPSVAALVKYWGELTLNVFGLWMAQLLLLVIAPLLWVARRNGMWRELLTSQRESGAVLLLGIAGLAQFIAIHAEPRLIAPFVMLVALGLLTWILNPPTAIQAKAVTGNGLMWQICSWVGLISALGVLVVRIGDGIGEDQRITSGIRMMQQAKGSVVGDAVANRLVVVGPAMPIVANAYLLNLQVVAQVRPGSVGAIVSLPPEQMAQTLNELFSGRADIAWITLPNGQFQLARIAPR